MYHQKIEAADTTAVSGAELIAASDPRPSRATARFCAALIVLCLPVILLWLLTRLVWEEIRGIARGVAILYRAAAEEISRS